MSGGSNDMGVFHGVIQCTGGNQAGRMRHVNDQDGAWLVGNFAQALVDPFA